MDINQIALMVEVGGRLFKIAVGTFEQIKTMLDAAPDVAVDHASLDALHVDYQARIARAKAVAGLSDPF